MHRDAISVAALAMSATAVCAQTEATYLLVSSNTVGPATPSTTIEIWATWVGPGAEFVFGAGGFDLMAGDGIFSNPVNVLNGPGSTTGAITGSAITGGLIGQLVSWPPVLPMVWDNPILLARYDWATTDFSPRSVALDSSNTGIFTVFSTRTGELVQMIPNSFTPGSGVIKVVPAPAAWLALPLFAARRRRSGAAR